MQQVPQKPAHRTFNTDADKIVDPNVDNSSRHGSQMGEGPLSLLDDDTSSGIKKIVKFDNEGVHRNDSFKRPTAFTGNGACRVRSFHCKYSDEGLKFMDNQINQWLDEHMDIEIKFVTSTVMTFQGKIPEPNLVLNLWY